MRLTALAALIAAPSYAQVAPQPDPASSAPQPSPAATAADASEPAAPATADPARASVAGDDIVVTARRVSESLQRVPLAVSALNGAALQRQGIREVRDLDAIVPNLQIRLGNTGGSAVNFTIRGQSQSNVGLLFIDQAVGTYIDGLNVPRNFGVRNGLVDIERVEVLRGPQGTLYGRNTTGGAISIITQDPKDELGAMAQGSVGNYDAYNVLGVLNFPLTEGVGLRLLAQHGEHGSFGRQVLTGRGLNDEKSSYFRAKLKIDRGRLKASLTTDYFRYSSGGFISHLVGLTPADPNNTQISTRVCVPTAGLAGASPALVGPACVTGGVAGNFYGVAGGNAANIARLHLGRTALTAANLDAGSAYLQSFVQPGDNPVSGRFYDSFGTASGSYLGMPGQSSLSKSSGASAVLNLDYEVSDEVALRSITGWRYFKREDDNDIDSTPLPILEAKNGTPKDDFYSQELQVLGNFGPLSFVLGGFYSYERGREFTPSIALQAPGGNGYGLNEDLVRNTGQAIFAQGNYQITDKLRLTLGGRYTKEVHKARNRNRSVASGTGIVNCSIPPSLINDPDGPVLPLLGGALGPCGVNLRTSSKKPTWLASLDYQVTQGVLTYAKVSRGFRGGGVQARANTPAQPLSFVPFDPEIVTEYELGFKSDLFDRLVRLNVAVFYDDYSNVQRSLTLPAPGGGGYTIVTNAASARLYGVEGEATIRPTTELTLNGSFGYLNAKYKEFDDFLLGDRSGEDWPAPKWTYSLNARYEKELSFGSASATVQWAYTGTQNLQPAGRLVQQNTQKGFGLLNGTMALRFADAGWELSAFGRNLLQKEYYTSGVSLESLGFNQLITGEPRTFGLQLTKRLGGEK